MRVKFPKVDKFQSPAEPPSCASRAECEGGNLRGDILLHRNEVDIDTINLPGVYEHISFFYVQCVCVCVCVCVRACASSSFPPLSPDCFYFICKFRLISLLQQCTRGVGGRNNLITFSLPPPAPWRILLLLTDNNKPCFWDTEYHFLPQFGFLNLKKTH